MLTRLCISGYRSLRDLRLELSGLVVVTGANGSGKSSLYRALRLLADIAQGRIIQSLANEGGLTSALWAGPESFSRAMRQGRLPVQGVVRQKSVSLKLGFGSATYGYAIDLGLPEHGGGPFGLDPVIKLERLWVGPALARANGIAERTGPAVRIRDETGIWRNLVNTLAPFDSMLTQCGDPREAAELLILRERIRAWRFYDHFRTDAEAPSRRRQVGTRTPVLASDGADLAAAIATIQEIGEIEELGATIADAFPGSSIDVVGVDGELQVEMRQHGLLRPLRAAELSDGTLRYLLLAAALLSPRPPELMVLNEPETSLHPSLLAPLARLIVRASARAQTLIVSHAAPLVTALRDAGAQQVTLTKELGETLAPGTDQPAWTWPSR